MAKVGVLGARGRMGREVVRVVGEGDDLDVVAEVDQGDDMDALTGCDVVVDFTHPGVVMENLRWCIEHDLDVVVGTSGFAEAISRSSPRAPRAPRSRIAPRALTASWRP